MALELAIRACSISSWGSLGRNIAPDLVSARVTICTGGGKSGGYVSLRLAHVSCSDSPQAPPSKRKGKPKGDGPTKSDMKLLEALREFIAAADLPPDKVPTTAVLASSGRQDLANQVRRRGYKVVAQLLQQTRIAQTGESNRSESTTVSANDSVITDAPPENSGETFSDNEGWPLPGGPGSKGERTNGYALHKEDGVGGTLEDQSSRSPLTDHKLHGEALGCTFEDLTLMTEEFIHDHNPVRVGDPDGPNLQPELTQEVTDGGDGEDSGEEEYETDDIEDEDDSDEGYYDSDDEDDNEEEVDIQMSSSRDPESDSIGDTAAEKAAMLRTKIQQYLERRGKDVRELNEVHNTDTDAKQTDDEFKAARKMEVQKELNQLKSLLHSRDLELGEISRKLEEAKGMLSLANAKANAELVLAKRLAVEQEARLRAAEQALSLLKKVHLEWWGEASQVAVAGSFNGWEHNVPLEPDISSEIPKPDGGRGPMMWGTFLCLYPGVYEIKFIIDGKWQVDHRRELVMQNAIQNNLLRVE